MTYKYDRATLAEFDTYDEWASLERIACPVLFIYGDESRLVRRQVMLKMAARVPDARVARIERAGHLPHLDNPADFEREVLAFCCGRAD